MASGVIRTLALNFVARTSGLTKGLNKAKRTISGFVSSVTNLGGRLTAIAGLLGATISVAGTVALIKSQMSAVDALAKTSDQLGITTQDLAAFQLQGELAGVGAEAFTKGIRTMVRSIADAVSGSKEAKDAIAALGLDPKALQGKSVTDAYLDIAEAINKVGNAQRRLDIASQVFGRGGQGLLSMFMEGRGGFEKAAKDANAFGLAISRVDAAKVEQANDAMTMAGKAIAGIARIASVHLSPIIEGLATQFVDWAKTGTNATKLVTGAMGGLLKVLGYVADSVQKLSTLTTRFAIVGNLFQDIFSFDQTKERANRMEAERMKLVKELEELDSAPRWSEGIRGWLADVEKASRDAANLTAKQRSDLFERSPFNIENAAGVSTGGSAQGPQGLLRGSSAAAAAQARFINGVQANPMLQEQKKGNELLQNIDRNIRDIRIQGQRNQPVGID